MSMSVRSETLSSGKPWGEALFWLVVLGSFFFASYGMANWIASQRSDVGSIVFFWEHSIPFIPWTIIPYWSIDLFYGLAILLCTTRQELHRLVRQLFTAQIIAVTCFILFPLTVTFTRPEITGVYGSLFDLLGSFDKPFNQAPSLHVTLLVILWTFYLRKVPSKLIPVVHIWSVLIGISVLTTYQHHFIDLPTGALLGLVCLWLYPYTASSLVASFTSCSRRRKVALAYVSGASASACVAYLLSDHTLVSLFLWWLALSLMLVAWNYACTGAEGFQKSSTGQHSVPVLVLFAPYMAAAWLNALLWTWKKRAPVHIRKNVWLGPVPFQDRVSTTCEQMMLIDMSAELPVSTHHSRHQAYPCLDLVPVPPDMLNRVVEDILNHSETAVHVACALGFSRSASVVLTWLVVSRQVNSVEEGVALLQTLCPKIVLSDEHLKYSREACRLSSHNVYG